MILFKIIDMILKIELVENGRKIEKAYENDFCFDVFARTETEVLPGVYQYKLGIKTQLDLPEDYLFEFDAAISFRPRSSVYKTGMILSNAPGTIDYDYTGELMAIFYHVMPHLPRYKAGDKIGQIHLDIQPRLEPKYVDKIDPREGRSSKGFGSSETK